MDAFKRRKARLREGIPVPDGTWKRLTEASGKVGLDISGFLVG